MKVFFTLCSMHMCVGKWVTIGIVSSNEHCNENNYVLCNVIDIWRIRVWDGNLRYILENLLCFLRTHIHLPYFIQCLRLAFTKRWTFQMHVVGGWGETISVTYTAVFLKLVSQNFPINPSIHIIHHSFVCSSFIPPTYTHNQRFECVEYK